MSISIILTCILYSSIIWCAKLVSRRGSRQVIIIGYALSKSENIQGIGCFFIYLGYLFINFKIIAMSHEKAKEQTKNKKEPTKSLKEKRAAKKAKKEEKKRQQNSLPGCFKFLISLSLMVIGSIKKAPTRGAWNNKSLYR